VRTHVPATGEIGGLSLACLRSFGWLRTSSLLTTLSSRFPLFIKRETIAAPVFFCLPSCSLSVDLPYIRSVPDLSDIFVFRASLFDSLLQPPAFASACTQGRYYTGHPYSASPLFVNPYPEAGHTHSERHRNPTYLPIIQKIHIPVIFLIPRAIHDPESANICVTCRRPLTDKFQTPL
jgi:hypothetical protein